MWTELLFPLKSSENHMFTDNSGGIEIQSVHSHIENTRN